MAKTERIAASAIFLVALFAAAVCKSHAEPIGLVLSGGGAKGAYEVGVWRALEDAGLASNVVAISGTSVGAINAALFATRPDAAERLWLDKIGAMFTADTNRIAKSLQKTVDAASESVDVAESSGDDWKGIVHFILSTATRFTDDTLKVTQTGVGRDGYLDSSNLVSILDKELPSNWPTNAPIVYATSVEKGAWLARTWRLNGESHGRKISMLQASAAIPFGFDTVEIDGKTYVDGGWETKGGDGTPMTPILENHREIRTVVVVYLAEAANADKTRVLKNRVSAQMANVRLIEIFPTHDIGGILWGWQGVFDSSPGTAQSLIELGRKDAMEVLGHFGIQHIPANNHNP